MRPIRLVLLVSNFLTILVFVTLAKGEMRAGRLDGVEIALVAVGAGMLALNFYYLLASNPAGASPLNDWRPVRMLRLWFDAKERDLEARAQKPNQVN